MCIQKLNLRLIKASDKIIKYFMELKNQHPLQYNNGELISKIDGYISFEGLYAFIAVKENCTVIVYVGKSESDDRLRQHLTGKNVSGSKLKESVSTKFKNIQSAINNGWVVKFSVYGSQYFTKSSLAGLEVACIEKSQCNLLRSHCGIDSWNERVG